MLPLDHHHNGQLFTSTEAYSYHSSSPNTSPVSILKMRYAIAASGILGLAAAAPQMINIDAALAVPTPTVLGPKIDETKAPSISYNPIAAAATVAAIVKSEGVIEKRDTSSCGAQQPGG